MHLAEGITLHVKHSRTSKFTNVSSRIKRNVDANIIKDALLHAELYTLLRSNTDEERIFFVIQETVKYKSRRTVVDTLTRIARSGKIQAYINSIEKEFSRQSA